MLRHGRCWHPWLFLCLVAVHLEPFLPGPAARTLKQLGVPEDAERPYGERIRWGGLPPATRTAAPAPLFPKLETIYPHAREEAKED